MVRWRYGEAAIEQMLRDGELEHVPADAEAAEELLAAAGRHVVSATALGSDDPEGAYSLAYDASRKCAAALLLRQCLRPTRTGGHLAVVQAMREQFPDVPGLRSLDMVRRRRNEVEYPDPARHSPLTPDEVDEAVEIGRQAHSAATQLLGLDELGAF